MRDEKWRFDSRTGYTAFSRRDGFRLANIFYLVDAISDLAGTSTKSYSQRDNIDALLHDRVKEPQISAYDFPPEDQPNMYQIDDKTQYSHPPYLQNSLADNGQTQSNEIQQNNVQVYSQYNQPQYDTEQGLAVNTTYEMPQNEPHKTIVPPILDTVHSHTGTVSMNANVETTTRRKIEGLSEVDDDELLDDPLGNRINPSVVKSLLG